MSSDGPQPLVLRTHTKMWQVERRLYSFYDYTLPMPVSLKMLGIFLATSVPWITVMLVVGIPFKPPFGHLVWLAPPALLTWFGNRPVAEGKRLGELAVSQFRYFVVQPKHYAGAKPYTQPAKARLTARVWAPTDADNEGT